MKENLKWLMLLPLAIVLAVVLALVIPRIFSDDSGSDSNGAGSASPNQSEAVQQEITDIQKKIDAANELIAANPSDAEALKELGISYEEIGKIQSDSKDLNGSLRSLKNAIDQFRRYLVLRPDDTEARIELGLAYVEMGLLDLGERELRTVTVAAPANQRAWHSLGWALSQEGKVQEAREAWLKSFTIDPASSIGQESKAFFDQTAQNQPLSTQAP